MRRFLPLFIFIYLISFTSQTPTVSVERNLINVYADGFGESRMPALYDCAERSPLWLVARVDEVDAANLLISINPSLRPDSAVYPVDEIEFSPAVNVQNPLVLSADDLQAIYSGRFYNWSQLGWDDAPVQLWVYGMETGLNEILLGQGKLSSLAVQAQSPAAMRDALASNLYGVGILPVEMIAAEAGIRRIQSQSFLYLSFCRQGRMG